MSQVRLLKRLALWQESGKQQFSQSNWEVQLLKDIEDLLNTQEGNALIDAQMGLSDLKGQFQNHGAPDIQGLEQQLLQQIQTFEKRITHLNLSFIEDNRDFTCFAWKLNATLVGELGGFPISGTIKLHANGQVIVESVV